MLIQCPECELQVSDKAIDCPHCGYPMKPDKVVHRKRKTKRRKRLPNGFGQITELKGRNLRKPFRAMVTVGKDKSGKPICKLLQPVAYFTTYNEAYAALLEYNKNPYDLDKASMTIEQLYEEWSSVHFKRVSLETERSYKNSWNYCHGVKKIKVIDLRTHHIKECLEKGTIEIKGVSHSPTNNIKNNIKTLFNKMLDYAVEYEIVDKNCSRNFSFKEITPYNNRTKHLSFTDEEMTVMWDKIDKINYLDVILIQCYSGWRPQELGLIKLKNVDFKKGTIVGGMKTESGIERTVPIHSKIKPFIKKRYEEAISIGSEYLFNCIDDKNNVEGVMTYNRYKYRFGKAMEKLGFENHKPHDGRKHFITQAKKYKIDEYAIKYIVGHVITDITENIYTDRSVEWLCEEMKKIK